jgi:phosphatidylserine decarboxylase
MLAHQYVQRHRNTAIDESLIADQAINFLYNTRRDEPGFLLSALGSGVVTNALAHWQFDRRIARGSNTIAKCAHRLIIRESELVQPYSQMRTLRELFERQIRYWDVRPQPDHDGLIVSPADGKLLPFSAFEIDALPIKSRFIRVDALLADLNPWQDAMRSLNPVSGVIVRLTPDVYHYTHAPVAGVVRQTVTIEGAFHSCNPTALVRFEGSYAFNRRTVTVYDTDVPGGTNVGFVVQVDVAAMMIGQIESRFSAMRYEAARALKRGDFVPRGAPVSLFRPGSSTSIVLWDGRRAAIGDDLVSNSRRSDLRSRFSDWLGRPWVETQVAVRQSISQIVTKGVSS